LGPVICGGRRLGRLRGGRCIHIGTGMVKCESS
jgi:hypothetical protein